MINSFTYNERNYRRKQGKKVWRCSQQIRGCTAKVTTNDYDSSGNPKVIQIQESHNHPPPNYMRGIDGSYVKIRGIRRNF